MKNFLLSMLSKEGVSSKRFWGSMVMMILCVAYIYCVITQKEMPESTYAFLSFAGVLLGLDTIISPFNKNKNNEEV